MSFVFYKISEKVSRKFQRVINRGMSLTTLFIFVSKILKWTDMQTDLLSWVLVGESDALHWSLLKLWLPESPQEKICYRLLQDYYLNWMLKVFIFMKKEVLTSFFDIQKRAEWCFAKIQLTKSDWFRLFFCIDY